MVTEEEWYRCEDCDHTQKFDDLRRFQEEVECPKCKGIMTEEKRYR